MMESKKHRNKLHRKIRHSCIYILHWWKHVTHPLYRWLDRYLSSEAMSLRSIWLLFVPLFADQLLISVGMVVNTAVISGVGEAAVSAVSMVDSVNALPLQLIVGIALGCTVVVAQCVGRGDRVKAGHAASQAITSSVLIAIAVAAVMYIFAEPLIDLMFGDAEEKILELSVQYLRGISISLPLYAISQTAANALRGIGDTKISMLFSAGVSLLNIIFNVLFISVMKMEIFGLILSLLLARLIGSTAAMIYLMKARPEFHMTIRGLFRIDFSMQRSLMMIGFPSASENLFFNGGRLICQVFIVTMGTASITANAIGNSLSNFYCVFGLTFAQVVLIVCGQCIGGGHFDTARKYLDKFIIISSIISIVFSLILLPFMDWMIAAYNPSPEAFALTKPMMLGYCTAMCFIWNIGFLTPSALRAGGDATFTSVMALTTMWVVRVVLGYLLSMVFGLGVNSIWVAMYIEWLVRGIVFFIRSRGKKWYAHKVI
ncbi:MAG: MATE family efflux transporter [Ruminococcaceae bacterium]|nr:MATE family efflux transporter [Oscillospiraceae bacterium]